MGRRIVHFTDNDYVLQREAEGDWAEQFERMRLRETSATESADNWAEQFERIMQKPEDQWAAEFDALQQHHQGAAAAGVGPGSLDSYEFEPNNPYVNHEAPFKRGIELLQKGTHLYLQHHYQG